MNELDLIGQGAELARRRKMQEALMAGAAAQDERAASGKGNVMDVLGSYLGRRKGQQNETALAADESAYRQRYDTQLQSGLNNYLDKRNGRPGEVLDAGGADALMNGDQDPGMLRAGVKADPRRAVVEAMTSQMPELQAIGKADFGQLGKRPDVKEHIIDGQLVRSNGVDAPQVAGSYGTRDSYGDMQNLGTDPQGRTIQGQRNSKTGEYKYAPGGGQTINVGDKQDGMIFEPALKNMDASRKTILTEQKNLDTAKRIYQLSQDPQLISGPGATPIAFLSSVGAKLGLNGPEAAAKTQAMLTDLAGTALARGQEMKGSFSDADIKFLQDVTAGRIEANPQVMREVAALAYSTAHNSILEANNQYQGNANVSELTKRASAMYPLPAIRHGNLDPKLFTDEEGTGRMRYNSPLRQPAGATRGGRVSSADFLKD